MGEDRCLALTSGGESCNNKATFPEDDPKACYIKSHQEQVVNTKEDKIDLTDIEKDEELKKELEQNPNPPQKENSNRRYITKTMYVI